MKKLGLILSLVIFVPVVGFAQESVTITTYYPSPSGSYKQLTSNYLTVNPQSTAPAIPATGMLYWDNGPGQGGVAGFYYWDGDNWNLLGGVGGGGLWTAAGSDIYYNTGNVGIGTDTPDAQLTVNYSPEEVEKGTTYTYTKTAVGLWLAGDPYPKYTCDCDVSGFKEDCGGSFVTEKYYKSDMFDGECVDRYQFRSGGYDCYSYKVTASTPIKETVFKQSALHVTSGDSVFDSKVIFKNELLLDGDSLYGIYRGRVTSDNVGKSLTINAGGAKVNSGNSDGGMLNLSSGISTGSGSSLINFQTAEGRFCSTGDKTCERGENTPTTKMTISGNGSVGIGITDPQASLEVKKQVRNTYYSKTDIRARGVDFEQELIASIDDAVLTAVRIAPKFTIYSTIKNIKKNGLIVESGNVGIGTANPLESLHVEGNVKVNGFIEAQNIAVGKTVSAGGWQVTTPDNLGNAVDSDESTATGWGQTGVPGNEGYINVDLGSIYRGVVYIKMEVVVAGLGTSWGQWRVYSSSNNTRWHVIWDSQKITVPPPKEMWYLSVPFWGRYIRVSAIDSSSDVSPELKIYEIYTRLYQ